MKTLKWFFVIFFAVFFANIASNFATAALTMAGIKTVLESIMPGKTTPATVRVANPLRLGQSDREALCESWQTLYKDSPKTPFRMQMETACKSVYGQGWTYDSDSPSPVDYQPVPVPSVTPVYDSTGPNNEKQRAKENDLRLCRSWLQIHAKEPTDLYRMYMNTACKRAYGNSWPDQ